MRIGINTFGLAEVLSEDFEGSIDKIKEAGITDLEPCIFCADRKGGTPEQTEAKLAEIHKNGGWWISETIPEKIEKVRKHGINAEGAHLMMLPQESDVIKEYIPQLIQLAKDNGFKFYVTSLMATKRSDVEPVVGALREMSEAFQQEGITLMCHNHHHEFAQEEGSQILAYILQEVPLMKLELDVGWVKFAGVDVVETMKQYKDRIRILHFKDITSDACKENEADCFTAIGEGSLPLEDIMKAAKELTLFDLGLILDQDKSNDDIIVDTAHGVINLMKAAE